MLYDHEIKSIDRAIYYLYIVPAMYTYVARFKMYGLRKFYL